MTLTVQQMGWSGISNCELLAFSRRDFLVKLALGLGTAGGSLSFPSSQALAAEVAPVLPMGSDSKPE